MVFQQFEDNNSSDYQPIGEEAAGLEDLFREIYQKELDRALEESRKVKQAFIDEQQIPENPGPRTLFQNEDDRIIYEFFPRFHDAVLDLEAAICEAQVAAFEAAAEITENNLPLPAYAAVTQFLDALLHGPITSPCVMNDRQYKESVDFRQRVVEAKAKREGDENFLTEFLKQNVEEVEERAKILKDRRRDSKRVILG